MAHVHAADLQGYARLAVAGVAGITDLVEAMHGTIGNWITRKPKTKGITRFVYRSIGGVTRLVGSGLDATLGTLAKLPMLAAARRSSAERDAVLAALNGVLGDYLVETGNSLRIAMSLRQGGETIDPASLPGATGHVLVLVHGLCMNDRQWHREGHDHGEALAREFGYTPLYLHYNTGQRIAANGREFADLLESALARWPVPVESLAIIGHSMGGLVTRSACAVAGEAGHRWLKHLEKIVFLGTPHLGAPLAKGGKWVDVILDATPWSAPFARLGKVRSAGIQDLRAGKILDTLPSGNAIVPLPRGVICHAIAASLGAGGKSLKGKVLGDGLVTVASALGQHSDPLRSLAIPTTRQWVCHDMGHMALLSRPEVYEQLSKWLGR
jgi:pimeloyl-ACP methyl ester carboxylesterase